MEHFVLRNGARAELQLFPFKLIKHNVVWVFCLFLLIDKQASKEKKKKKKKSKEVLFNSSDLACYPPAKNRGGLPWCLPGTWWTPFHAHILQR